MFSEDEIYRRCHNHYNMAKDEIKTLVLDSQTYTGTDAEKLNAFYADLLLLNREAVEAVEDENEKVAEDDYELTDADKERLLEIGKSKRRKKKVEAAEFEKAGAHLPPEERGSYSDLIRQLRALDVEDEGEDK